MRSLVQYLLMSRKDYIQRINRVIDYIDSHLADDLKLEVLADVAAFSPYHFHRIFSALMGEPLYIFIRRLRLEKAAARIASTDHSITEIALDCGFNTPSVFARSFREYYGQSASEWRASVMSKSCKQESKNSKTSGKNGKAEAAENPYHLDQNILDERRKKMKVEAANVRVENVEDMTVAYVRHIGPYAGDEGLFERLFGKLFKWAGARDLLKFPETKILSVYHDDPHMTDEDKLRTSVCITVPPTQMWTARLERWLSAAENTLRRNSRSVSSSTAMPGPGSAESGFPKAVTRLLTG